MRIANSTIARNYTASLGKSQKKLNDLNTRVITANRFDTVAEDPAGAVRAFNIRRSLATLDTHRDNANTAKSVLTSAESALMTVSNVGGGVQGLIVKLGDAGYGTDEHKAIISELENTLDQLVGLMNSQFSDRYLFGGANTKDRPFNFDKNTHTLTYNGQDVATVLNPDSPLFDQTLYDQFAGKETFLDIGLGLTLDPVTGQPNPNSVYKDSLNGLEILGLGQDNLILRLDEIITAAKSENFDQNTINSLMNPFLDSLNSTRAYLTDFGAKDNYLDFIIKRLDDEELNLAARQDAVEKVTPEKALMDFAMQEYVYNAALQMGQKVLQPTIFSFIS